MSDDAIVDLRDVLLKVIPKKLAVCGRCKRRCIEFTPGLGVTPYYGYDWCDECRHEWSCDGWWPQTEYEKRFWNDANAASAVVVSGSDHTMECLTGACPHKDVQ